MARIHRALEHERAQVTEELSALERPLGNVDRERLAQLVGPEAAAHRQLG